MPSDERPKRSWREIDSARDRSAHRRDQRPDASGPRHERTTKRYRSALSQAFDSGALGKLVGEAEGQGNPGLIAAIREAHTPEELSDAVDRALAAGPLPDDAEVWARVVEHRDEDRVREALLRLEVLLGEQTLRRSRALRARLRYLEEISDDEEIRRLSAELRNRLPA